MLEMKRTTEKKRIALKVKFIFVQCKRHKKWCSCCSTVTYSTFAALIIHLWTVIFLTNYTSAAGCDGNNFSTLFQLWFCKKVVTFLSLESYSHVFRFSSEILGRKALCLVMNYRTSPERRQRRWSLAMNCTILASLCIILRHYRISYEQALR